MPEALFKLALLGGALGVLAGLSTGQSAAGSENPIGKLSVTQQSWRREGKFLILEITLKNENPFPVEGVIISCEIRGDPAKPQDSRGVAIRQPIPQGSTKVQGLEFSTTNDKAQGSLCNVDSAERVQKVE
jgi:hypothetical protein